MLLQVNFDSNRIYASLGPNDPYISTPSYPSFYDMTIDYGSLNVKQNGQGITTTLVGNEKTKMGAGTRLSTTRYMMYAKITAKMRAIPVPGVITTFITMSARKDEIDFEFVGGKKDSVESNVFYKGILEFGIRSRVLSLPSGGTIDQGKEYTIDWNSKRIEWSIDGNVLRRYAANDALTVSSMTPPGERS